MKADDIPPPTLSQRRRMWSDLLRDVEWWVASARKSVKKRDYAASRSDVLMACAMLDEACQYDVQGGEG